MTEKKAPNRLTMLALAEARIFQAVVIDKDFQKRNIAIYQCGADCFYAANLPALFERDVKQAPKWLRDAVNAPPEHAVVYDYMGQEISPIRTTTAVMPASSEMPDLEDHDISDIRQG